MFHKSYSSPLAETNSFYLQKNGSAELISYSNYVTIKSFAPSPKYYTSLLSKPKYISMPLELRIWFISGIPLQIMHILSGPVWDSMWWSWYYIQCVMRQHYFSGWLASLTAMPYDHMAWHCCMHFIAESNSFARKTARVATKYNPLQLQNILMALISNIMRDFKFCSKAQQTKQRAFRKDCVFA